MWGFRAEGLGGTGCRVDKDFEVSSWAPNTRL